MDSNKNNRDFHITNTEVGYTIHKCVSATMDEIDEASGDLITKEYEFHIPLATVRTGEEIAMVMQQLVKAEYNTALQTAATTIV